MDFAPTEYIYLGRPRKAHGPLLVLVCFVWFWAFCRISRSGPLEHSGDAVGGCVGLLNTPPQVRRSPPVQLVFFNEKRKKRPKRLNGIWNLTHTLEPPSSAAQGRSKSELPTTRPNQTKPNLPHPPPLPLKQLVLLAFSSLLPEIFVQSLE